MAHIVCITGGLTGIFNASLALVNQLEQVGHRLTYASSYNLHDAVTAQGLTYVQLDPWVIQPVDPPMSRWKKLRTLQERQQRAVDELGVQHFVQTIQTLEPDLVLIDMEMTPHIMAGVMGGLPIVLLCQFLSIWKRATLSPINSNIIPGKGVCGSWLGIQLSWLCNGLATWKESQQQCWKWMGLDRRSIWSRYARQINYPFPEQFGFTQWLISYNQGQLPILCFNALELDFPHDPHPLMHYVGPMVCDNRQDSHVTPDTWYALEQLFDNRRSQGRSLIYCGCSTFIKGNQQWLANIVEAFANRPQWDLVVGLGGQLDPKHFKSLPTNVYVFDWTPQLQVLKHADCAVINGGINTINECIYFGVPMLLYSLGHADQNGDTTRVAYHGLGIVGNRLKDTAVQIRLSIQMLLTNPAYQECVSQMRDRIHHYHQENRAAKIVGTLLIEQKKKSYLAAAGPV